MSTNLGQWLSAPPIALPFTGQIGIDNTQPVGINPITISSVSHLGFQSAINSCSCRDLGFTGQLAGEWYAIFGDTLWCAPGVTDGLCNTTGFYGMVRDSISLLTEDPLKVVDLNLNDDQPVPHQNQFVPFNPDWGETNTFGFGGTSLCEVDTESGVGAVYYLVVSTLRQTRMGVQKLLTWSQNANEAGLVGAGVAKVEVVDGTPTVTERFGDMGYWWDSRSTARYGDASAYRDERSEYIYIWGGPPTYITDWLNSSYAYLARVKATNAFDLSKYEYYWGRQQGWKSEILTVFTPETAVLWGTGQGQVFWSPYYKLYILVHLRNGK